MVQPVIWRGRQTVNQVDTPDDDHTGGQVIQLANGNVLIAYTSTSTTGAASPPDADVIGTLYDPLGNVITSEIRLNFFSTSDAEFMTALVALADGGFAVVYLDVSDPGRSIRFDRYNAAGGIVDSESVISDTDGNFPSFGGAVAASQGIGSTLVVYEEQFLDSGNVVSGLRSRLYNGTSFGAEIDLPGTFEQLWLYEVAALSSGNYALVAQFELTLSVDRIVLYLLDANGASTGVPVLVEDVNGVVAPDIAPLPDGRFLVSWQTTTEVRAAIYNDDGTIDRAHWGIPTNAIGVKAAALVDGGYVLVWNNASTGSVVGQAYNADGSLDGGIFTVVNDVDPNTSYAVSDVQGLDDGRFIVVLRTISGLNLPFTQHDTRVERVIMDPRSEENSPNVYTTDQVVGTVNADIIAVDALDDRVYGWSGNDTFQFDAATDVGIGDIFDGGVLRDTIAIRGSAIYDFRSATVLSFEELSFYHVGNNTVRFDSSQISTAGLSSNAVIDGFVPFNYSNRVEVYLTAQTSVNLSGWIFTDWIDADDDMVIIGDSSSETIIGTAVGDTIFGNGGIDTLDGRSGADDMSGGDGSDLYYVENVGDLVTETNANVATGGTDRVIASITYTLPVNVENLTMVGTGPIIGNGNGSDNFMSGNAQDNTLRGWGGDDVFLPGLGNDWMSGGIHQDFFVFNTALGPNNRDGITDFSHADDTIRLDDAIFTAVGVPGALSAAAFHVGTAAADALDRIIYNPANGQILYDADGLGGTAAVLFATLTNKPQDVDHTDFVII